MKSDITAIVIAHNESEMIANCLETLRWCDEVVVVDHGSEDGTPEIAERSGARVIKGKGTFADLRNSGLNACKTEWLVYIDADERVTPQLAKEIKQVIDDESQTHVAFTLHRQNILYGHLLQHGGWGEDRVVRVFKRTALKQWQGRVHESAEVDGSTHHLESPLVHLTHRDFVSGLVKSGHWTPIEASELFKAGVKPVTAGTLFRKTAMELWRRIVVKKGYKDGTAGWVEAWVQAMNRLMVYIQVWELQQKPPLPDRYRRYEESILKLWQSDHEN